MLKRYRQDFVLLNMTIVGVTLLLTLALLAVYIRGAYRDNLRMTMSELLKPISFASSAEPPAKGGDTRLENERQNFATVIYTPDTDELTVLSQTEFLSMDEIGDAVRAACASGESFGTLPEYDVIYYRENARYNCKIALTGTAYLRTLMTKLILTLAAIFLGAMALFFFVSLLTARRVARPIEDAFRREKRFLADASHELKTPLTVLLANLSILRFDPTRRLSEQMRWIDSMESTANGMRGLVEDMLSLSEMDSLESSNSPPEKQPVDLSHLAINAVLEFEPVAYDGQIRLETDIGEGIFIDSMPEPLRRILRILLDNALKYEPPGGLVRLTLSRSRTDAILTVANRSSQIAEADLPHVFERFYRAADGKQPAGHGLGLSIARQLVRAQGGSIRAESRPGEGTRFTVTFG